MNETDIGYFNACSEMGCDCPKNLPVEWIYVWWYASTHRNSYYVLRCIKEAIKIGAIHLLDPMSVLTGEIEYDLIGIKLMRTQNAVKSP